MKQEKKVEKYTLLLDGPLPFEETKHQKSQGRVALRGDIVILDLMQSSVFQTIYIPSKTKGKSHFKENVRDI